MPKNYKYYLALGNKLIDTPYIPKTIKELINYTTYFDNENGLLENLFKNGFITQQDCDRVASGTIKLQIFKCHENERYLLESGIPYADATMYLNYPMNLIKKLLMNKDFVIKLQRLFNWNNMLKSNLLTLSINLYGEDTISDDRDRAIDSIVNALNGTPLYKYQLGMLIKKYEEEKAPKIGENNNNDLEYVTEKLKSDYNIDPLSYDGDIPEQIAFEGTSKEEADEILILIQRYNSHRKRGGR